MAAAPKLSAAKWKQVRNRWETDTRAGFEWVVKDMGLPVTAPAVRKKASTEGWKKQPIEVTANAAGRALAKVNGPKPCISAPESNGIVQAPVDELVAKFGMSTQQALHAREYMVDFKAEASALRAGYSAETAAARCSDLIGKPAFQAAIAYQMRERLERMGRDADELVKFHLAVLEFDANEVCEHRIHACRHCWGVDFTEQHTPSSWKRERDKWEKAAKKMSETERALVGEFPPMPPDGWYEAKRGPNDDCPECHGVGISVLRWRDSRYFSPQTRLLFAGVKSGKEGLEMVMLQKQASLAILSNHLGLNKPAEAGLSPAFVTETAERFHTIMERAQQRQHAVLLERGLIEHGSAG